MNKDAMKVNGDWGCRSFLPNISLWVQQKKVKWCGMTWWWVNHQYWIFISRWTSFYSRKSS